MKSEPQCSTNFSTKKDIRKNMLSKRNLMNSNEVREYSDEIFENFCDLNFDFQRVMIYLSFKNEVMTERFISQLKFAQKHVSIPYCIDDLSMDAVKLVDFDEFKVNKYDILEPENPVKINKNTIELCIIPGVAFDGFGARIGFGKGYYDRFLKDTNILKIGLCYDFQIMKNPLPSDINDIKMDYIISEKRIIKL